MKREKWQFEEFVEVYKRFVGCTTWMQKQCLVTCFYPWSEVTLNEFLWKHHNMSCFICKLEGWNKVSVCQTYTISWDKNRNGISSAKPWCRNVDISIKSAWNQLVWASCLCFISLMLYKFIFNTRCKQILTFFVWRWLNDISFQPLTALNINCKPF